MLDAMKGLPSLSNLPPVEIRKFYGGLSSNLPLLPEVGQVRDGTYPCADGSPLEWRLYLPPDVERPPLVVYFHSGGWIVGSAKSGEQLCRTLCVLAKVAVISMDYRHAPENKFPAAPDDARAAVQWAHKNAAELGARDGPLVVSGASAGGNIAVDACLTGIPLAGLLLIVPVTDSDGNRPSCVKFDGYGFNRADHEVMFSLYADKSQWKDPRIACCYSDALSELPTTVVFAAECDMFRDEAEEFVQNVNKAGGKATFVEAKGHLHMSLLAPGVVKSGHEMHKKMADALQGMFAEN